MSQMEIEMTVRWGDNTTTITQSFNAFSDECNEALEANTRRVAAALVDLTRYEMEAN